MTFTSCTLISHSDSESCTSALGVVVQRVLLLAQHSRDPIEFFCYYWKKRNDERQNARQLHPGKSRSVLNVGLTSGWQMRDLKGAESGSGSMDVCSCRRRCCYTTSSIIINRRIPLPTLLSLVPARHTRLLPQDTGTSNFCFSPQLLQCPQSLRLIYRRLPASPAVNICNLRLRVSSAE